MIKKYQYLLAILILALLVRSIFIGTYFTGDAIDTVGPARNFAEIGRAAVYNTIPENCNLFILYLDENGNCFTFSHPPMKTLLYSIWALLFGFNTFMIFLPIIFGLLSIILIYLIAKDLYSEHVGLIAALLAALLRYHFYASTITFGDNFLMMTVAASIYIFLRYLKTKNNYYIAPFFILMGFGFLTKLSVVTIIPVLVVIGYIFRGKAAFKLSFLVIAASIFLSFLAVYFSYPLTEALTGVSNSDFNFFESYIKTFFAARTGYQDIAYEKTFYVMSFAWQMTPFFAALLLLALIKLKRDKPYIALSSWLMFTFFIGFTSSGQDFQRLMIIAIVPAIILTAKFLSDIKWEKDRNYILFGTTAMFFLAYIMGLNDMLPHYTLSTVAFFFVLAAIFIFVPKNKQLLLGASVGFSIFFLFGTNFLVTMDSSAASQITDAVREREYPYKELWTDRDISLYLAPEGQASFLQRPELTEEFIKEKRVKYIAFYSVYEEDRIINISKLCEDEPFFAVVNRRKVGIACKIL